MTCEECIHWEVCRSNFADDEDESYSFAHCHHFKRPTLGINDTVYLLLDFFGEPVQSKVVDTYFRLKVAGKEPWYSTSNDLGRTVFLTKEEAEKAVTERKKK